jgi:hypothetical protein
VTGPARDAHIGTLFGTKWRNALGLEDDPPASLVAAAAAALAPEQGICVMCTSVIELDCLNICAECDNAIFSVL